MTEGILSHHEVMYKLDMLEMERGQSTKAATEPAPEIAMGRSS